MAANSTVTGGGSLNRQSKKKKSKDHKLHIAAALMPTQAFAIAPSVRCELPEQPGLGDPKLNRLNQTALSSSLVRRSLDRSLDLRDEPVIQQTLRNSSGEDSSTVRQSADPDRVLLSSGSLSLNGLDATTMSSGAGTTQNDVIRVNLDPAVYGSSPANLSATQQRSSLPAAANEEVVLRRTGKLRTTFASPPTSAQSAPPQASESGDTLPSPPVRNSPNSSLSHSAPAPLPNVSNQKLPVPPRPTAHPKLKVNVSVSGRGSNGLATNFERDAECMPVASPPTHQVAGGLSPRKHDLQRMNSPEDQPVGDSDSDGGTFGEITEDSLSDSEVNHYPPQSETIPDFRSRGVEDFGFDRHIAGVKTLPESVTQLKSVNPMLSPSCSDATNLWDSEDGLNANLESSYRPESVRERPKKGNTAMHAENRVLQESVQRLSVELSRYQAVVAIQSGEIDHFLHVNKVRPALSSDEPLPLWLVDQKYLSPLFASYDAIIRDKDRLLREAKQRLEEFDQRLHESLNSSSQTRTLFATHSHSAPNGGIAGGVPNNWPEIVEQCKQVIDDNSQLKSTIEKQAKEINELEKCHVQEVSRLNEKTALLEAEVAAEHSRFTSMLDRYHALDELVRRSGVFEKALHDGQKVEVATEDPKSTKDQQLETRLKETEAALIEAETKYAAVYDRAKSFAESIVKLSSENKQLLEEKSKRDKALAKQKHRVASLQQALALLQTKDSEKNNLLKDLMSVTDDIAKQRNELAENLHRASTNKNKSIEQESIEKEMKLKWLEAMVQNSASRAEKEEIERRKLEENLHAVWEATVLRDRNRLSSSGSLSRLDRSPSRNSSIKFD